jgi:DNA-binding GntR family transcriptional regulator
MTPKRERVACGVRAAIEHGQYTDGQHLIPQRLASEYGVTRDVIWRALDELEKDGWVSFTNKRYLVNANHVTRQLQRALNFAERLDLMEKKLDALCWCLLPASGKYAPPGVRPLWSVNDPCDLSAPAPVRRHA